MADPANTLISCTEARSRGLRRYFTGKPCPRGHFCERIVVSRACVKCEELRKPSRDIQQIGYRRRPDVKVKRKQYNKAYHGSRILTEDERIRGREATKRWRLRNIERARELDRLYASRRKEQRKEYGQRYQAMHPERAASREQNKRAKKLNNGGSHTPADIADIFRMQRGKCACCRTGIKDRYHVDHIVPSSKGGSNDRRNLQLLCPPCNHSKYARDPIEFMQSKGKLL